MLGPTSFPAQNSNLQPVIHPCHTWMTDQTALYRTSWISSQNKGAFRYVPPWQIQSPSRSYSRPQAAPTTREASSCSQGIHAFYLQVFTCNPRGHACNYCEKAIVARNNCVPPTRSGASTHSPQWQGLGPRTAYCVHVFTPFPKFDFSPHSC